MQTYTPANSIYIYIYNDAPVTNLLSILFFLIEVLSRAHAKGWEGVDLNDFQSGAFIGRFPSDDVVISTAMKGLRLD